MNKIFNKVAVAFVGIAMAIGVGVAVGQRSEVKMARATTTEKTTTMTWGGTSTQFSFSDDGGTYLQWSETHGSNSPIVANDFRMYANVVITISAKSAFSSQVAIKTVAFTGKSSDNTNYLYYDSDSGAAVNNNSKDTLTFTTSNSTQTADFGTGFNSVVVSRATNGNNIRITQIVVTYDLTTEDPVDRGVIDSIEMAGDMTKKAYLVGEDFDYSGLKIQVNWTKSDDPTYVCYDLEGDIIFDVNHDSVNNKLVFSNILVTIDEEDYAAADYEVTGVTVTMPDPEFDITISTFTEYSTSYTAQYTHVYSGLNNLNGGVDASVTIYGTGCYKNGGFQMRNSDTPIIKNTTAIPGRIVRITATWEAAGNNSVSVYGHASSTITSTSGDGVALIANGSTSETVQVYEPSANSNYKYFMLTGTVAGGCKLLSLLVEYGDVNPTVSLTDDELEVIASSSVSTTFAYENFKVSGAPVVSAVVKSGTALTASAVSQSGTTITVNAGASTGDVVFTLTFTKGEQAVSLDLAVTVLSASRNLTNLSITTNSNDLVFYQGGALTASSLVITATFDAAPTTVEFSEMTALDSKGLVFTPALGSTLNVLGNNTIRVSYSFTGPQDGAQEVTKYVEYTVNVLESATFSLVEDENDLVLGDTYILGSGANSAVASTTITSGYFGKLAATFTNNEIDLGDLPSGTLFFTLLSDGDGDYYLVRLAEDNYKPINVSGTNFAYNSTQDLTGASSWPVSISSGSATIGTAGTNRVLYNVNSPRFKPYSSNPTASMVLPNLYRMSGSIVKTNATDFANNSLKMNDDSYSGQVNPGQDPAATCASNYNAMKTAYSNLSAFAKNLFQYSSDYSAARLRMNAWAEANHQTFTYGEATPFASTTITVLDEKTADSTTLIIVVLTSLSVLALGGYFLLRRKEN